MSMMPKVIVHRFEVWDQMNGCYVMASRMATPEGIARLKKVASRIVPGTAVEVDAALVGREEPGLTDINFEP
jgi:hypothetical protein